MRDDDPPTEPVKGVPPDEVPVQGPCLCGHPLDHHDAFGCIHGCTFEYCTEGTPSLKDGVVEQYDENGIPWL